MFLNNCRHGRDPLRSSRGVSVFQDGAELELETGLRGKLRKAGNAPFAVVSFEDMMPPAEGLTPLYPAPETCVIIYRSFLHWSASLLRKIQGNEGYGPLERMRIMMQSLRTYGVMLDRIRDKDVVPVCYDKWVQDEAYRQSTLARLQLPGADLDLGRVQRYGGGSSFQARAEKAAELATAERSAQMAADLEYQLLLWTTARDIGFMLKLAEVFPHDAERLSQLLDSASAKVTLI